MSICDRCNAKFDKDKIYSFWLFNCQYIVCPECKEKLELFMNGCELKPLIMTKYTAWERE